MEHVLARRLNLLELEGKGFSRPEITKQLATKYNCSLRNVQYDFETRTNWQPKMLSQQALLQKTLNRFEYIYKQAAWKSLHSRNESVQLGALRLMSDVTTRVQELVMLPDLKRQPKGTQHIELSWLQNYEESVQKVVNRYVEEKEVIP